MEERFPKIRARAQEYLRHPEACLTPEGMVTFICHDCPFWHDEEENYECGAFRLLKALLEKGVVSVEQIVRAATE